MANGQVTKAQGLSCLATMQEIADGGRTTRIERGHTCAALEAIGWLKRDPEDYFDYEDRHHNINAFGDDYAAQQVLMALAWCVTLSGFRA